jgi:GxxExxY protein
MVQQPNPALTEKIIGLGIKVHRTFGAGLLESVYNQCLCWEPHNDGLAYEREVPFAVVYQGVRLDKGFLADIVVENSVLLEIKYVERILPVHEAQTRTYLKLSGCRLALLMNFGTPMLKDGIRRFIN